jgi:hypothetical protein
MAGQANGYLLQESIISGVALVWQERCIKTNKTGIYLALQPLSR